MKKGERASWRERGSGIRSLDYLNHYKSVSNHPILLLFRERERGGLQVILFPRASLLFLYLFYLLLLCIYSRMGYEVTCPDLVSKWSFLPDHSSSQLVGTGHACCVQHRQPASWLILMTQGGWVWSRGGCAWGCGCEEAVLRGVVMRRLHLGVWS